MAKISNIYEGSPASLRAIIVMGAVLLTVLAGLFMVIGALLGTFVFGTVAAAASPSSALLIIAIVLLALILALLLVLLACSGCLTGKGRFPKELISLLPLIPLLPAVLSKLGPALKATSVALQATSASLGVVRDNLSAAGEAITIGDISVPVPSFETTDVNVAGVQLTVFSSVDFTNTETILASSFNPLTGALDSLDAGLDQFGTVVTDLEAAAALLDELAEAVPASL